MFIERCRALNTWNSVLFWANVCLCTVIQNVAFLLPVGAYNMRHYCRHIKWLNQAVKKCFYSGTGYMCQYNTKLVTWPYSGGRQIYGLPLTVGLNSYVLFRLLILSVSVQCSPDTQSHSISTSSTPMTSNSSTAVFDDFKICLDVVIERTQCTLCTQQQEVKCSWDEHVTKP